MVRLKCGRGGVCECHHNFPLTTNTRIRTLAEHIVAAFEDLEPDTGLRSRFNHLLLTAHQPPRRRK
ncbi:hypothetical protein P3H15_53225 [Rhodococcus sp. T2V]|uniref:hypothetical protein n=1 Tax=Rhodococcus sp. T2V TaxID=3034164 RepID=UPI0023E0FF51|nr:hypothetical protein [Rhodococcus sp. T2V]MDF3313648.1 hypothetical protein [Rhodococcus sp. T2V]